MGHISDYHPVQDKITFSSPLLFDILSWFHSAIYHPVTIKMNCIPLWNRISQRSSYIEGRELSLCSPSVLSTQLSAKRIVIAMEQNVKDLSMMTS